MIEIVPGNYYVGFWTAVLPIAMKGDYMACLWLDEKASNWKLVYRFRYHEDDKSFDSNDRKQWHGFSMSLDVPEDELVEKVNLMTSIMIDPKFYPVRGDHEKALEAMMHIPTFHVRMLEPDDPRVQEYTKGRT